MHISTIIAKLMRHPDIKTKTRIAEICNIALQSMRDWTRVPAEYVLLLEDACGGSVTRYQMRPDVFGPDPNGDKDDAAA